MNRSEDHKDAGLQEDFNVLSLDVPSPSHHTKCERERVQHTATITTARKRPRPGRRRLSRHHLPLSLTQISLFVTIFLSVLCMPTEAAEHPGSQSRAVKDHFVDGRIMFDHKHAPLPALHPRDNPVSTNTASTITAAEAAVTSSTSDSSTPTISLPRAFDGGFGTNYTQPSCPTFLRSMVNNDTFISCVPFSLLLQVRHFSQTGPPSETNLPFPRTPCPSSTPLAPSPPSPPSSTPPALLFSPLAQPSCPRSPSPSAPPRPAKTTTTAKTPRSAKHTPLSSPMTSLTMPPV